MGALSFWLYGLNIIKRGRARPEMWCLEIRKKSFSAFPADLTEADKDRLIPHYWCHVIMCYGKSASNSSPAKRLSKPFKNINSGKRKLLSFPFG